MARANSHATRDPLMPLRCPGCHRLAAEAGPESVLRVKCQRCKVLFEWHPDIAVGS